jgi:hypothetical protein
MKNNSNRLLKEEALREENEILKLKLIAEHGSKFEYGSEESKLSAEIENVFLQQVLDFERKEAVAKEMSVFEVLGSPQHFPKVEMIGEERIKEMLWKLLNFMESKRINIAVLRPNVSDHEMYRFITQELFTHRMLHIDIEGMTTNFIYDEFHPDYAFDNSNIAVNDCLRQIFNTNDLEWTFHYDNVLQLNQTKNIKVEVFRNKINIFKKRFEHIEVKQLQVLETELTEDFCFVSGTYEICFISGGKYWIKTGSWEIHFRFWKELDIWMIFKIQVEGISF